MSQNYKVKFVNGRQCFITKPTPDIRKRLVKRFDSKILSIINQSTNKSSQSKAARAKDRKYTSQQPHEQAYKSKRVSPVQGYKTKNATGNINSTTTYKAGGSAGTWNIAENGKFKRNCTTDVLNKMIAAKSRFQKDWRKSKFKTGGDFLDTGKFVSNEMEQRVAAQKNRDYTPTPEEIAKDLIMSNSLYSQRLFDKEYKELSNKEKSVVDNYQPPQTQYHEVDIDGIAYDDTEVLPKDYEDDNWRSYAKGGYIVFNYTDDIPAAPDVFKTKKAANEFITKFRKRFEAQGYYRDNRHQKINPEHVDLEVIPSNFNPYSDVQKAWVGAVIQGGLAVHSIYSNLTPEQKPIAKKLVWQLAKAGGRPMKQAKVLRSPEAKALFSTITPEQKGQLIKAAVTKGKSKKLK